MNEILALHEKISTQGNQVREAILDEKRASAEAVKQAEANLLAFHKTARSWDIYAPDFTPEQKRTRKALDKALKVAKARRSEALAHYDTLCKMSHLIHTGEIAN